jgi:hypothetical protein
MEVNQLTTSITRIANQLNILVYSKTLQALFHHSSNDNIQFRSIDMTGPRYDQCQSLNEGGIDCWFKLNQARRVEPAETHQQHPTAPITNSGETQRRLQYTHCSDCGAHHLSGEPRCTSRAGWIPTRFRSNWQSATSCRDMMAVPSGM